MVQLKNDKKIFESFELNFFEGLHNLGGNLIPLDPIPEESVVVKAPFIFSLLQVSGTKISSNYPLISFLLLEEDLIRGAKNIDI